MLRELTGHEPDCSQSPDEAVVHGAALYAGMVRAQQTQKQGAACELINVNSHSLGVVGIHKMTGHKQNVVLIAKNTPLPAHAARTFRTAQPDQRSIRVPVVEGESDRPEDCIMLGECVVRELPPGLPRDTPIEVQYHYAANGRLSVIARVPSVRYSAHVEIERDQMPDTDSLDVWHARLIGNPADACRPTSGSAVPDTLDLNDQQSLLRQLDALYMRVGKAASETTSPGMPCRQLAVGSSGCRRTSNSADRPARGRGSDRGHHPRPGRPASHSPHLTGQIGSATGTNPCRLHLPGPRPRELPMPVPSARPRTRMERNPRADRTSSPVAWALL